MEPNKALLVCMLLLVCTTFAIAGITPTIDEILQNNPLDEIIGTVDGKTYIMNSTARTWTAAKAYCDGNSMRLATINSQIQHDFLLSKADVLGANAYYWTGGRDYLSAHQFVWDMTNQAVVAYGGYSGSTIRTALAFRAYSTGYLYAFASGTSYPVLCETLN